MVIGRDATFQLGPITLDRIWEPLLHARVRALRFPALPEVVCHDCGMVKARACPPRTKCCSYLPDLPSFLAGAILARGQQPGSPDRVASWVETRGDPLFVYGPPALQARYREAVERGPLETLPCPLLSEDGRCTVYGQRPYLCTSFHCRYPDPVTFRFWNALTSLLALHSAVVSQYLAEQLGVDRKALGASWSGVHRGERTGWTERHQLAPDLHREVWQDRSDPAAYYRACFELVRDRVDTIRGEVDRFRRRQLLLTLEDEGTLTDERAEAIRDQPTEPTPLAPPRALDAAFGEGVVVFAQHRWTVPEHEGFCLFYHDFLYGEGGTARTEQL